MKITIESTDQLVMVNGRPARVWKGLSEGGVECQVLVFDVAVHKDADNGQFERELLEHPPIPFEGQRAFIDPRFAL